MHKILIDDIFSDPKYPVGIILAFQMVSSLIGRCREKKKGPETKYTHLTRISAKKPSMANMTTWIIRI